MDVHTPPPSYEAATGVPGAQQPYNPFYQSTPPTAPTTQDDEITSAPITMPILPQTHRISPNIRPYNPISYPVTRPTPQTNNILRRERSKNSSSMCLCFFITLSVLVVIVVILVLVAKGGPKAKYNSNSIFHTTESGRPAWEKDWWDKNQDMLNDLQKRNDEILQRRRDESKWNFQSFPNNN